MLWQLQISVPNQFFIAVLFVCAQDWKRGRNCFPKRPHKVLTDWVEAHLWKICRISMHRGRQVHLSQRVWTVDNERKQGTFKTRNETMHREVGVNKSHRAYHKCHVRHVTSISYSPKQQEAIKRFEEEWQEEIYIGRGRETWNKIILAELCPFPHTPSPNILHNFRNRLKIYFF